MCTKWAPGHTYMHVLWCVLVHKKLFVWSTLSGSGLDSHSATEVFYVFTFCDFSLDFGLSHLSEPTVQKHEPTVQELW